MASKKGVSKRKYQEILNWPGFGKIFLPVSTSMMKTIATVLTQKGVGTIICPKCNELNIVRDGLFQCSTKHCRFRSNIIDCACGICGQQLLDKSRYGYCLQYIRGHDVRRDKHHNWNGGRRKYRGYWLVLRPEHRESDQDGYVFEHRIVYEEYHKCCLLPWSHIHHRDKDGFNNEINNLILTSKWEHRNKYHKEDFGQICIKCGSNDVVRNGFDRKGKHVFRCSSCRMNWTVDKDRGIDFGQVCYNCGSKYAIRCGKSRNKQIFRCNDCRKYWLVPLHDLKQIVPENDHQYRGAKSKAGCPTLI